MALEESLKTLSSSPVPPPAAPRNRMPPAPMLSAGSPDAERMLYESKPLPRLTVIPDTLASANVCESAPLIVVVPSWLSISTVFASRRKTSTALFPLSLVSVSAVPATAATTFPARSDRTSSTSAAGKTGANRRCTPRSRRRERPRSEFHVSDLNGLRRFIVGPPERRVTWTAQFRGLLSPKQKPHGAISHQGAVIAG